jgi:hypothetical protein
MEEPVHNNKRHVIAYLIKILGGGGSGSIYFDTKNNDRYFGEIQVLK